VGERTDATQQATTKEGNKPRKAKVRQAGRGRIAGLQDYRVVDNSGHVEPIADPILKPEPPQ
jgi:hypothetical protein